MPTTRRRGLAFRVQWDVSRMLRSVKTVLLAVFICTAHECCLSVHAAVPSVCLNSVNDGPEPVAQDAASRAHHLMSMPPDIVCECQADGSCEAIECRPRKHDLPENLHVQGARSSALTLHGCSDTDCNAPSCDCSGDDDPSPVESPAVVPRGDPRSDDGPSRESKRDKTVRAHSPQSPPTSNPPPSPHQHHAEAQSTLADLQLAARLAAEASGQHVRGAALLLPAPLLHAAPILLWVVPSLFLLLVASAFVDLAKGAKRLVMRLAPRSAPAQLPRSRRRQLVAAQLRSLRSAKESASLMVALEEVLEAAQELGMSGDGGARAVAAKLARMQRTRSKVRAGEAPPPPRRRKRRGSEVAGGGSCVRKGGVSAPLTFERSKGIGLVAEAESLQCLATIPRMQQCARSISEPIAAHDVDSWREGTPRSVQSLSCESFTAGSSLGSPHAPTPRRLTMPARIATPPPLDTALSMTLPSPPGPQATGMSTCSSAQTPTSVHTANSNPWQCASILPPLPDASYDPDIALTEAEVSEAVPAPQPSPQRHLPTPFELPSAFCPQPELDHAISIPSAISMLPSPHHPSPRPIATRNSLPLPNYVCPTPSPRLHLPASAHMAPEFIPNHARRASMHCTANRSRPCFDSASSLPFPLCQSSMQQPPPPMAFANPPPPPRRMISVRQSVPASAFQAFLSPLSPSISAASVDDTARLAEGGRCPSALGRYSLWLQDDNIW